jgi:hypothetical protein
MLKIFEDGITYYEAFFGMKDCPVKIQLCEPRGPATE